MADRYWVGGSGTWNTTSTTNWSASSGGSSGASVPTAADSVFFDQAGTYTVTMTGALNCLDITVSAGTVTFATGTTPTLSVAGNWSTIAGTVWNSTGTVTFTATTAKTITSGGITIDAPFTFNGAGGTWTLQDSLTLGSTRTATLTAGTLALGTFTLTTGLFASSGTGVRTLNFGTGKIVVNSATTSTVWTTATVTNLTVSGTPLVECQGGGTAVTKTINTGTLSEANAISFSLLETTGTATYAFTASNVVKNLTINGVQTVSNIAITIYGFFTHSTSNGTTTFTAGANAWTFAATSGSYTITNIAGFTYDFPWTFGSATSTATWTLAANLTLGATRQLTLTNGTTDFNSKTISAAGITIVTGTPSIANTGTASFTTTLPITHTSGSLTLPFNFTTSSASGYTFTAGTLALGTYTLTTPRFSSDNNNARTLNFGTGKIVLNGSVTATIWTTSTATNFTVSGTPLVECIGGGTSVTKTITTGLHTEANTVSFSLLETTGSVTYTITGGSRIKNFVVNGTQTLSNTSYEIYGNFTHLTTNGTTTFTAGTQPFTFAGNGNNTITNIAGFTYDFPWQFGLSNADSTATWTLSNNLTLGATKNLILSSGTFDFNNKTFSGQQVFLDYRTPSIANTGGGGSLSLTVPFTVDSTAFTLGLNITTTGLLNHSAGTFNLNNYTFTCLNFAATGSTSRNLNFGTSGQIAITGNNLTVIDCSSGTGTGWTASGTVYFNLTYTGSTGTRVIDGGGVAEATAVLLNISTSGTSGIVINPAATDTIRLVGYVGGVDLTGFTGTITNTNDISVFGNLVFPATGGTITASINNTWIFRRTTAAQTITTNGRTIPLSFYFLGNTVQLLDNLTLAQDNYIWHRAGNFDLNNYTYTANTFNGDGSFTRVIQFGNSGQININGNNRTVLDFTDTANLSFTGNVYFNLSYTGSTGNRTIIIDEQPFVTNSMTRAENEKLKLSTSGNTGIVVNSAATDTLILNCRLGDANFVGFSGNANGGPTFIGNLNLASSGGNYNFSADFDSATGNKTITSNGRTVNGEYRFYANTGNWIFNDSATLTGPLSLWAGRVYLNDFTHNIDYLEVQNNGNNQVLDFGTSSQLNCTDGGSVVSYIVNIGNSTNLSYVGTPKFYATYSGSSGYRQISYSPSTVTPKSKCLDISFGTSGNGIVIANSSDSIRYGGYFNNINYNGSNNSNDGSSDTSYIYGNLTYTSNTGNTGTGATGYIFITEAGSTSYIDCTRPINRDINIQADGNVVLQNNFSVPYGIFFLTKGNLNLNNYNIITTYIRSNTSNSRSINFANSSTITLTDNGTTLLDCNNASNLTFTGTPKIYSNYIGSSGTRTFDIGSTSGATANNILSVTMLPLTNGASGQGVSGDTGGGFGGGLGGGVGTSGGSAGGTGGVAQNVEGLSTAVTGAGYTFGSGAGAGGGSGSSPANQKNGTSATGFGAGGGGAGYYGGNGGNGYLGGGGGGAAGYSQTNMAGGSGGNGAIVLQMTVNGSPTYVVLTSGTTYNTPAGTTSVKIWAVGAGGGGAGSTNSDSTSGGGGGAGGVAILTSTATGTITYSIGTGGAGGIDANSGSSGGNTTATFDGNTITAYGGGGGGYNNSTGGTGGTGSIVGDFNGIILTQGATDTISLKGNFKDIDLSGFTMSLNNLPINVWGNYTIPATGGTLLTGGLITTFMGPNTQTVTTNGRTLDFPITIGNGTSNGNVRLGSALTLGSTRTFTLTSGKFNLNDFTATANLLVANGTNIRSFDFANTGQFTLVGSNTTVISMPTMINFNTNGNARFNSTYTGATGTRTFAMGNTAGAYALNVFDVSVTDTKGIVLGNTATDSVALVGSFRDANFTGLTNTLTNTVRTIYGNLSVPATGGTITAGTSATTLSAPIVTPGSNEYSVYFDGTGDYLNTPANAAFTFGTGDLTLECWIYQTATSTSTYRVIFGDDVYGSAGGYTLYSYNNALNLWKGSAGGGAEVIAPAGTINLNTWTHVAWSRSGSSNRLFINGTQVGATTTDSTNFTSTAIYIAASKLGTFAFAGYISNARALKGTALYTSNFTPPTSPLTAIANTSLLTCQNNTYIDNSINNFAINVTGDTGIALQSPFVAFSPVVKTITTNNRTLDFPIIIGDGEGGGINQLSGNLTLGSTRSLTLTFGTIDLNNLSLTTNTFTTTSGTKNILFNGGTLTVTGSGATAFNNASPEGFTTTKGNGNGTISMTSTTAKTFVGNNSTYNCALDNAGSANLTITGNNTFENIKSTYAATTGNTFILFPAAGTTNVQTFIGTGNSATSILGIMSATAGSRSNISLTGNGNVNVNFVNVRDINFSPMPTNGSGPMRWYIGSNSINSGNVRGALLTNGGNDAPIVYALESGTSWTVPNNWNSSNNVIYLYGAGGGGAGGRVTSSTNKAAGGGGGGGGFTSITNFSTSPGQTISYTIGIGGTGGTANANGTAGGNTIWSSTYTANGGNGGGTTTVPTSVPGTGGTGIVSGGLGGYGAITTVSGTGLGAGGGGGAGGTNGVGGAGGNGIGSTTAANTAGGGGGGSGGGAKGGDATITAAGIGGNNVSGTGGGAASTQGILGGGGGGARNTDASGKGGSGVDILSSLGGGGGAGATSNAAGSNNDIAGIYGGGGAGGGVSTSTTGYRGGDGSSGSIVIFYYACNSPVFNSTSTMFMLF